MDFSSINWLAVIACVLASMVIGSIWFSPKVFYPAWTKAIEKIDTNDPNDQNIWPYHTRIPGSGYIHGFDGQRDGEYVWRHNIGLRRAGWLSLMAWLRRSIKFDKQTVRGPCQGLVL